MSAKVEVAQRSRVAEVCLQLSRRIRKDVADGKSSLPPERELARTMGVSRTVLREATKKLELQGLLEVRHGVGLKLVERLHSPLTGALELLLPEQARRLEQLAEARRVVEPELARLAAERAKPSHLAALRRTQSRLQAAIDTAEAIDADLEFHRILAKASGNQVLELLLESLGDLGRESRRATLATTGFALAFEHHAAILRAIEGRNPQAAFTAMKNHVETAQRDLTEHFKGRVKRSERHVK